MDKLLIVLVIYKRDISTISIIKTTDCDILIYDNSLNSQLCSNQIHYIHDPSNAGVSKAYNEGIKLARNLGKKYVLLLDQDTKFNIDMLEKYFMLQKKYGDEYIYSSIVGREEKIYSPFAEKNFRGKAQNRKTFIYEEKYCLDKKSIINSGMMIPLRIINEIGNFNENIKLDFGDMYFVEKYKKRRKEIILVDNFLEHSISGDEGKDENRELSRFKFYCNGAKEMYKELKRNGLLLTVFLRMIKLSLKYRSIKPVAICFNYFLGGKKI